MWNLFDYLLLSHSKESRQTRKASYIDPFLLIGLWPNYPLQQTWILRMAWCVYLLFSITNNGSLLVNRETSWIGPMSSNHVDIVICFWPIRFLCMCVCVCRCSACRGQRRVLEPLEAGVTGSCEPSNMGAWNPIQWVGAVKSELSFQPCL